MIAIQNATRGQDQNGLGVTADGPMYTLDDGSRHAVAFNARQDPVIATQGGVSRSLTVGGRFDYETETFVTHSLRADGFDASEDGTGRGTPLTLAIRGGIGVGAVAFNVRQDPVSGPVSGPVDTVSTQAVFFAQNQRDEVREMSVAGALSKETGSKQQTYVNQSMSVRRLTPRECERLQGFPDDWTAIKYKGKPAADGNRYKALGNSMAVPVMAWIGKRIAMVDAL